LKKKWEVSGTNLKVVIYQADSFCGPGDEVRAVGLKEMAQGVGEGEMGSNWV